MFEVISSNGAVRFIDGSEAVLLMGDPPNIGWTLRAGRYAGYTSDVANASPFKKVFRGFDRPNRVVWQVPHWFFVLSAAALGISPWLRIRAWRFSLRTLLIAMTVIAVLLGVIVAAI